MSENYKLTIMKELSMEEKAKAYDEAIEKARLVLQEKGNEPDDASILSKLFPELKESEDEKIRKEIIDFIYDKTDTYELREKSNSWLSWLEKQGEQKPAWSEENENMLENTIGLIEVLDRETKGAFITKEYIDFLKSLKERYTWRPSEGQKEALLWCVVHLGGADKQTLGELLEALNKL